MGVSALGGSAEATVFLDLDTSASVTMTLNAAANAGVAVESTTGDVTTNAGASVDGCVGAAARLDVNAGAEGSFFGIFDKSTKVPLFGKEFPIFDVSVQHDSSAPPSSPGGEPEHTVVYLYVSLHCRNASDLKRETSYPSPERGLPETLTNTRN